MIPKKNILRAFKKSIKQPGYAFQNISHRLKSGFSYHFENGKSFWPETISIFLTYRCNLKCKMCGQWGEAGVFKQYSTSVLNQQLSLDEIKQLIDDVKFFKPNITLFGGEPLIYPDFVEVIKIIKSAGLRCNLITNGILLASYAEELINARIDEIIFSLDGSEEVHDGIRGIKGAYKKALEGFETIHNIKSKFNLKKPLININSTIFENNYDTLIDTIESSKIFFPDNLTFHHLLFLNTQTVNNFQKQFVTKFQSNPKDWQGFANETIPNIKPEIIIEQIKKIKRIKKNFDISFYPNFDHDEILEWYKKFTFKSHSYKNRCMSLWMTSYIFPDGSVRPYHSMNHELGNIKANKFTKIWNNDKYKTLRKYIIKKKSFNICSKGCTEFFRY